MSDTKERIQKKLANSGFGSRREIEQWLRDGRIKVDGEVASLGDTIDGTESIEIDNKVLDRRALSGVKTKVIVYHKPEGEVCSRSDPEGRCTVFSNLPKLHGARWVSIGRLDINTSGLLLFTNNGELANRLMHPSYQIDREYAVRVLGEVSDQMLQQLRDGVMLEDGMAKFSDIKRSGGEGANKWFHVVLMEGRNREVRRMWEALDLTVSRLSRVRFAGIKLLKSHLPGKSKFLSDKEVASLMGSVGMEFNKDEGRKKNIVKRNAPRKAFDRGGKSKKRR
ncbi:MAG: pseudouridine synthase [Gammaproteobacteria bacterium]|nr:MAG: pseudouridine synthase [Gammaproteobacteria bacterium]